MKPERAILLAHFQDEVAGSRGGQVEILRFRARAPEQGESEGDEEEVAVPGCEHEPPPALPDSLERLQKPYEHRGSGVRPIYTKIMQNFQGRRNCNSLKGLRRFSATNRTTKSIQIDGIPYTNDAWLGGEPDPAGPRGRGVLRKEDPPRPLCLLDRKSTRLNS